MEVEVKNDEGTVTTNEEKEHVSKSPDSPAETQITETDASTLPSPEYTDVESDLEGMYIFWRIYSVYILNKSWYKRIPTLKFL